MSDILKQIQALQEQFSNLFEVEGLGDPSADVPPSDNKIKRRVKTKNGKAELVSVEDELFPYEGDKKDQYRQKIIDTINGMIQGTSTLQDLLQIVRQKKAPLKEAMELMEELLLERNKENRDKKEKWELKTNNITKKYKKAIQDYAKQEGDEAKFHREAAADYDHIYSQQPAQAPDGSPNSVAAYFNGKYQEMLRNKGRNEQNIADEVEPLTKKLKNRKHSFHDRVRGWTESEALEEAISLMEAIINEFNDDVKVKVGKIRADRALDSMKQLRNNSIALRKAQNSGEREKIANEMSKNSDELDVNYKKAKKFINLFNKNVKDNNKKQELKNYIESRGAADDKEYQEKASEALEEALQILEGLFIKDGRGDLIDDILKATTGKTLSDHAVAKIKAALGAGKVKNAKGKVKK